MNLTVTEASNFIFRNNKKYHINPFYVNVPYLYPLKMSENQRFSVSGGIAMGHWHVKRVNPFRAVAPFPYPLKTSRNVWFQWVVELEH